MRIEREWEHPTRTSPGRWVYLVRVNGMWGYGSTANKARLDALHGLGYTPCKHGNPTRSRGGFYSPGWARLPPMFFREPSKLAGAERLHMDAMRADGGR